RFRNLQEFLLESECYVFASRQFRLSGQRMIAGSGDVRRQAWEAGMVCILFDDVAMCDEVTQPVRVSGSDGRPVFFNRAWEARPGRCSWEEALPRPFQVHEHDRAALRTSGERQWSPS